MAPRHLAALAPPLALAVAGVCSALASVDRAGRASTVFLALYAAALLSALALTAPARSRVAPIASLAAFAALVFLPRAVPLPAAALAIVLAAAIGISLAERARSASAAPTLTSIFGLVVAAQLATRIERVFLAPASARSWLAVLGPALLVALVLRVAARERPAAALGLGLATFAAGPGWGLVGCAGVVVGGASLAGGNPDRRPRLAALGVVAGALLPLALSEPLWLALGLAAATAASLATSPRVRGAGNAVLAAAALVTMVAGGLPWRLERPLESVLSSALSPPFRVVAEPVSGRAVVLDARRPSFETRLDVAAARAVVVDSYLTNSVALPCGTPVARLVLELESGERVARVLRVGDDTSEWAAARPDVARSLACAPPPPLWSWIPAGGRFLGSTYRGRRSWPGQLAPIRLRLVRDPDLPAETALAVFRIGVER